jgi:diguanylate cyclase (GGDEF)-like protein
MAKTLNGIVRPSDIVCRMGGDEFILLCSGIETEEQAQSFAQRIKKAMIDAGKGERAWAGISVGKAKMSAGDKLEEVIEVADADLYDHKKNNR